MEIKILHKQGKSIHKIAEITGHSRNTVRRYLRDPQAPDFGPRVAWGSKPDPYKVNIRQRINATMPHKLLASVVFHEIRAQGFKGRDRLVRHFVSAQYPDKLPGLRLSLSQQLAGTGLAATGTTEKYNPSVPH